MNQTSERPAATSTATRANVGFLLAKASQRWNELLYAHFSERGYGEVRPAYGSMLLPLFEEDGLRMGELARRARLAKQTMTTMVRLLERDGLVRRETDPDDGRATRVFLTDRALSFRPVAERVLRRLDELVIGSLGARRARQLAIDLEEVSQPMRSHTVTTVLAAPRREVFAYMSEIENLPEWATEFARELRRDDDGYTVVNNLGEFRFEIRADEESGVIDMLAGPSAAEMAVFPTRVVELADEQTAYTFTMFQGPGMPDELFDGQYESLKREFTNIEARFA